MARLPVIGADNNAWGAVLNGFLQTYTADWLNITGPDNGGPAVAGGVVDNTTVLQAKANAASAAGVPLYIPFGTFLTGPITVTGDLRVIGSGWGSVLKLKNASNGYLFTFSPSGAIRTSFEHLAINGNAENQTSGGCILAAGAVESQFDSLHLFDAYDVCLWLYQIGPGNIGHHNRVTRCLFDVCNTVSGANQMGLLLSGSDENYVALNDFENCGGLVSSPGADGHALKDWSGLQKIIGNVFVGNIEGIRVQDASSTRIIGNTFDGGQKAQIHLSGSKNIVQGNLFSNGSGASAGSSAQLEIDNSSSCVVAGNAFTVGSTGQVRNCVQELSSSSHKSLITGNVIDISGTLFGGNTPIELLGTGSVARGNPGFNPVGPLTEPTVPATTVPLVNPFPADVTVYITAGTSTCAVAVGGTSMFTLAAAGTATVRLAAAQSLTLTYTNTPTWKWAAD